MHMVSAAEDHEAHPVKNGLQRPSQPQEKNVEMMNEEGDEINELLRMAEDNLDMDPALREQIQVILNHINQLKNGDLLKRVDSLVALNDLITVASSQEGGPVVEQKTEQKALIRCCNQLIAAFTHVMKDIFSYPVNDIPLRFTKYFITIVNKTCASKEIMREVSESNVFQIAE